MRLFLFLFAITAVSYAGDTQSGTKHLSVKYDLIHGYYDLPKSLKEIKNHYHHKYALAGYDSDLNVDLYSYKNDPRVFVLLDKYGNIAGLRVGVVREDVTFRAKKKGHPFLYDYSKQSLYSSGTFWDTDIWYTDVLFVAPEILRAGGREKSKAVVAEDIFLKLEGKWTWISKDECQAEAAGFHKQGCFIGMGMHYYYKLNAKTECTSISGLFLLFESGQLIGLGFSPFGSFTASKKRTWFEDPPALPIKVIVPHRPPCLLEWLDWYGVSSIHIFFEKYPRFTSCAWPWQRSNRCKHQ